MRSWSQLDFIETAMPKLPALFADMAKKRAFPGFSPVEPNVLNNAKERALIAYALGFDTRSNEVCETFGHLSQPSVTCAGFGAAHGAFDSVVIIATEFDVTGTRALSGLAACPPCGTENEADVQQQPADNHSRDVEERHIAVEVGGDGFHSSNLDLEKAVNSVALVVALVIQHLAHGRDGVFAVHWHVMAQVASERRKDGVHGVFCALGAFVAHSSVLRHDLVGDDFAKAVSRPPIDFVGQHRHRGQAASEAHLNLDPIRDRGVGTDVFNPFAHRISP